MKAKVLMYAPNGNDLVTRNVELTETEKPQVFYYTRNNRYMLVVKSGGLYFEIADSYILSDITATTFETVINYFKSKLSSKLHFNKLELEFAKTISNDFYNECFMSRTEFLSRKEAEKKENERVAREKEIEKREIEKAYLQNTIREFSLGTTIDGDDYLAIIDHFNIKLHPRTRHNIIESLISINKEGEYSYRKIRNKNGRSYFPKINLCEVNSSIINSL